MKRIAFILAICILGTSAFAAVKRTGVKSNPIAETAPVKISTSSDMQSRSSMPFAALSFNDTLFPSLRFDMGWFALDLGATLASPAANQINGGVSVRGEVPFMQVGTNIEAYWAPRAVVTSVAGVVTLVGSFLVGCEYVFAPHLAVYADVNAFNMTSANGTWTAGTNTGNVYSGVRVYF